MSLIIGVDPGKSGALAFWDSDARKLTVVDMPLADGDLDLKMVYLELGAIIKSASAPIAAAYIEKVGGIGSQSAARSFTFGFVTGAVHAALVASGINIKTVTPQKWKGSFGLIRQPGESQPQFKTRSRALAVKLAPEYAGLFKRAKDDGRAEAFLIAYYGAAVEGS